MGVDDWARVYEAWEVEVWQVWWSKSLLPFDGWLPRNADNGLLLYPSGIVSSGPVDAPLPRRLLRTVDSRHVGDRDAPVPDPVLWIGSFCSSSVEY